MENTQRDESLIETACRESCGACCIAPSISSAIPGMPHGKAAGVRCIQLTKEHRCQLFGKAERPAVCGNLKPVEDMCGKNTKQAFQTLARLERITRRPSVKTKQSLKA